jgi:hypothetical protein
MAGGWRSAWNERQISLVNLKKVLIPLRIAMFVRVLTALNEADRRQDLPSSFSD